LGQGQAPFAQRSDRSLRCVGGLASAGMAEWFVNAVGSIQAGMKNPLGQGRGSTGNRMQPSPWTQLASVLPQTPTEEAQAYNKKGTVFAGQGKYDQAMECFQKSLDISLKFRGKDRLDAAKTYNNIGEVFRAQGNYPKAMEMYQVRPVPAQTPNLMRKPDCRCGSAAPRF